MKIYFAGSIRAGRDDVGMYSQLIAHLSSHGQVLTEHVGSEGLIEGEGGMTDREIHDRDLGWLFECDAVIAEVTIPSLGVGYEVGRAIERGKPVLCLYRPRKGKMLSAMISGTPDVELNEYTDIDGAREIIDEFFRGLSEK